MILIIPARCSGSLSNSSNSLCCTNENKCEKGMGDCDSDSECAKELICGVNNCKTDFSHEGSNWNWYDDCCTGW